MDQHNDVIVYSGLDFLQEYHFKFLYLLLDKDMKQNSDGYWNSPLFVDTEFVPNQMGYFTIFDPLVSKAPNVLPYSHDLVTSNELQEKVSKIAGMKSQVSLGKSLILDMSIKDLKKKACKKKIKGEEIIISSKSSKLINFEQLLKKEEAKRQGKERCDICCIMLANKTDVVHLSIDWRSQQRAREEIVQEINYRYGIKVSTDDVQLNKLTFNFDVDENEVTHIRFLPSQINNLGDFIFNSDKITYVGVRILSNQFQIDREAFDEQTGQPRQKLIKFQVDENQFYKFEYEKIRQYKIREILGIIGVEDAQSKGVKVMDKINEPDELVESLDKLFRENAIINFIIAEVISPGETFWSMINKSPLLELGEIKKLANTNTRQRLSFDNQDNTSALNLFNSDFQLIQDKQQDNFPYLYHKIHKYIRTCFTHFTSLFDSSISSRFVGTLKDEIMDLPKYEGSCYRKLAYDLNCKIGDILTFNNFILTTSNNNLIQHGNPSIYPTKKTLIKIFSKTGREVKKHSSFLGLNEVIFLPFTKFQVLDKGEKQKTVFLNLQEIIEEPKRTPINVILWVDDKKKQGIKIYQKLSSLQQSIYLYQIDSTSLLQKWIKCNKELIASKSVQIIVITNMRRFQEGVENQIAGIHTIRLALSQLSKAKIIVYIGNIQNTMQHLKNHEIPSDLVYVTNSGTQLIKNLKLSISGKEKAYKIATQIDKKEESVKSNDINQEINKKKMQVTLMKKPQKPQQPKPVSSILESNQENYDEEVYQLPYQSNLKKVKSSLLKYLY